MHAEFRDALPDWLLQPSSPPRKRAFSLVCAIPETTNGRAIVRRYEGDDGESWRSHEDIGRTVFDLDENPSFIFVPSDVNSEELLDVLAADLTTFSSQMTDCAAWISRSRTAVRIRINLVEQPVSVTSTTSAYCSKLVALVPSAGIGYLLV